MLDLPFIDAHHHLWDLQACRYPWLLARGVRRFFGDPTPIQKNYLVEDLLADAAGLPLVGSVHVQVGVAEDDAVAETRWLQRVAEAPGSHALPSAIVAFCDLASASAPQVLAAHREHRNLRGIRQILGRRDDEDRITGSDALIDDARFAAGLEHLCELDLSFDLQLVPTQAQRVARLLERVPRLRVAICHCGSPWDRSAAGQALWREGLRALAALPRVCCKISGFGMFEHAWSRASIEPLVHTVLEVFGAERCMFGSNFPVEKLASSYRRVWHVYDELTGRLPRPQRERLFHGTAAEFYRIAQRPHALAHAPSPTEASHGRS